MALEFVNNAGAESGASNKNVKTVRKHLQHVWKSDIRKYTFAHERFGEDNEILGGDSDAEECGSSSSNASGAVSPLDVTTIEVYPFAPAPLDLPAGALEESYDLSVGKASKSGKGLAVRIKA